MVYKSCASFNVKYCYYILFSEVGKTELLDEETQGAEGILDVFKVPALGSGVGISRADFFVDSNHPRVNTTELTLNRI